MEEQLISLINDVAIPVAILLPVGAVLWRSYQQRINEHLADLRKWNDYLQEQQRFLSSSGSDDRLMSGLPEPLLSNGYVADLSREVAGAERK